MSHITTVNHPQLADSPARIEGAEANGTASAPAPADRSSAQDHAPPDRSRAGTAPDGLPAAQSASVAQDSPDAERSGEDVLATARQLVAAGISVIPWQHRTKEPAHDRLPVVRREEDGRARPSWSEYRRRRPSDAELQRWFHDGGCGIATICGAVSEGLMVLDIESAEAFEQWRAYACSLLDEAIVDALPVVRTGRGKHVYFRMDEPLRSSVLARRNKPNGERREAPTTEVLAETRGEGSAAVTAPTIHPLGRRYTVEHGSLSHIPRLTPAQVQALLDAARALSEEHTEGRASTSAARESTSVIQAFNASSDIRRVLEEHGYRPRGTTGFIRPGGDHASVIVLGDQNRSLHFNTNDPLHSTGASGVLHAQTPFSIVCELDHGGDVRAAVRHTARQLGMESSPRRSRGAVDGSPASGASARYLDHAASALELGSLHDGDPTWPYFEEQDSSGLGGLWMFQPPARDSPRPPLQLTNFTARITAETEIDDGAERQERYTLVATCGSVTRTLEMSREEFEGDGAVSRIVAALGARARLNPRAEARFVRDAIKAFSTDVASRTVFAYTGWIDDYRRFLFGNGYVNADGWQRGEGAQLPARLQQYQLDADSLAGASMGTALATFDALLSTAPPAVMIPLLGAVLLPPIARTIRAGQPMVHVYGITGSHKTALTCAAMALWGSFAPAQPTDTWTSTPNSIQKLGWYLKDMPFLLDDYKAAHVRPAQVTFLLQNYGDGMARGRLDANAEARTAYPIRATLISSGEDQPDGEASALARILSVPLARGQVDRQQLSRVQAEAASLPLLLVDYLAWLATHPPVIAGNGERHARQRSQLLEALEAVSDQATNPGRVASNVAMLGVAWHTFGQFLLARGYWREERVTTWLGICAQHLRQLAAAQVSLVTDERYSVQFLQAVRGLLASGRAQLQNLELSNGELVKPPTLLGGYDRAGTYLLPVAYDEVRKYRHQMGMPLTFSQKALLQMFEQEGLLVSTDHRARRPQTAITRYLDGKRHRCWHLPPAILFESEDSP